MRKNKKFFLFFKETGYYYIVCYQITYNHYGAEKPGDGYYIFSMKTVEVVILGTVRFALGFTSRYGLPEAVKAGRDHNIAVLLVGRGCQDQDIL